MEAEMPNFQVKIFHQPTLNDASNEILGDFWLDVPLEAYR